MLIYISRKFSATLVYCVVQQITFLMQKNTESLQIKKHKSIFDYPECTKSLNEHFCSSTSLVIFYY